MRRQSRKVEIVILNRVIAQHQCSNNDTKITILDILLSEAKLVKLGRWHWLQHTLYPLTSLTSDGKKRRGRASKIRLMMVVDQLHSSRIQSLGEASEMAKIGGAREQEMNLLVKCSTRTSTTQVK